MTGRRGFVAAVVSAAIWRQVEKAMSKWKYDQAGKWVAKQDAQIIPGQVKTSSLLPVVNAYISNAHRIHALWKLKPDLVENACVVTGNVYQVAYELTGHVDLAKAHTDDPDFPNKLQNKMTEFVGRIGDPESLFDSRRAIARLEGLIDTFPPAWDDGFYATLSAMLTTGWTTFEVLATDLWEAALNYHPRYLSDLIG